MRCLSHARDQGGEGPDQDPALCLTEDVIEGAIDHCFGGRPARLVGVGRIGHEGQHAPPTKLTELGEIRRPAIDRGMVELVVPGVDDQARRRCDRQPHAVGDRMTHVKKLDLERTDTDLLAGADRIQLDVLQHSPTSEFSFEQTARQPRGVDRG